MGRIADTFAALSAPPAPPTSRIAQAAATLDLGTPAEPNPPFQPLDLARALSTETVRLPLRADQALKAEIVRLAQASQQIPSFQSVAPMLGAVVRQPLQLLHLPTEISGGFLPGTTAGDVARSVEEQAQNRIAAALADQVAYGTTGYAIARGVSAIRRAAVARGLISPEILAPARPPALQPVSPIQEAELVQPPRALPAPQSPLATDLPRPAPIVPQTTGAPSGGVIAPPVQPRLLLPEGSGMVAEGGSANVPPQPVRPVSLPTRRVVSPSVRPPSVSAQELASTHPGLVVPPAPEGQLRLPATQLLGDRPELRGRFVIPITRAQADALSGQYVSLAPGRLTQRVFSVIPEAIQRSGEATGLQYLYAYDLPPATGKSYGGRSVPTPSPAYELREPSSALTRTRRHAITVVQRELFEQAKLLNHDRLLLRKHVLESGGIKPTLGFGKGLSEELQAIKPFLRSGGRAIDDLATELGFENGEALREALIAGQGAKIPTLAQLRRQAQQIVDSAPGQRIIQVLQAKGATGKAITVVVKDITRQTQQELSAGQRQVRGILTHAQRKAMTPAQLSRFARAQRVEPGATVTGPRGGAQEAPLSPADVRRVEAMTERVVPHTGQPTGTPPVIPRSQALIPAEVPRPLRDLNQFQSTTFSGLDPSRAAQVIDGKPMGPTERQVVRPLRHGEIAMRRDQQSILTDLRRISGGMKRGSVASRQVFQLLENERPSGLLAPQVRETAAWLSEQFDRLLERVNEARASVGKRPIIRRQNYITHITDPTFWEAMREAFGNVPDDATATLSDKFYESLRARPPGFRFGLPRKGGPFQQDAIAAFEAYLPAALRVQHLSVPARLAGVYVDRSLAGTPNASKYFNQLIRQVATGEAGSIAKLTPSAILRASNWLKGRFGKGTVLGNLSSVLQQVFTLPATVSSTGSPASTTAAFWLSRGDGLTFASQWSTVMQGRVMELDTDLQGLFSRWDQAMAAMFQAADRQMVAHSFLSGYVKAVAEGKEFQAAIEAGDFVAQRTQSSFLKADLPPVFRDAVTSSFLQFQGTINGVFNFMIFDIPHGTGGNPFKASAYFVGTFLGLAAIYEALGLPKPDRIAEFIPGLSTMRSGGPVGIRLLMSFGNLGSADAQQRAQALKDLKNASFALVLGAGGNQLRKSLDGLTAVGQGGKYDKRGRLQFPVTGLAESARAIAFGPYQTKAGRAYIQRGFKPASNGSSGPLTGVSLQPRAVNGRPLRGRPVR